MALEKNMMITGLCEGYSSEALGIVRYEGRAIFVRGLLRGEAAEIRVVKVSNTAVYGIIERLLSPSPERRTPDCPVYPRCGGCRTRHMSYAEELRFKSQRVEDALRRIG
ncbi:MAG: 23S rRNA (uracil(1939)-C(5))-methyltransferase RlmD, partial [bacterium]